MDRINDSTQSVYEAIKVISQISFQTNILSLNAAVEAATAGEAGKGFAVVAQEVRNLANRSADAAKTIESLMDTLKSETEKGKTSSESMKEEFNKLNDQISDTLKNLENIVEASQTQKRSIEEINSSISTIEYSTEENSQATANVGKIAVQTHNVAHTLVESNKDVNFEGKEAIETPDEIIKSIFTNDKIDEDITPVSNPEITEKIKRPLDKETKKDSFKIEESTKNLNKLMEQKSSIPTKTFENKSLKKITESTNDDDEWSTF
jgi:uncharacterized protein YukE